MPAAKTATRSASATTSDPTAAGVSRRQLRQTFRRRRRELCHQSQQHNARTVARHLQASPLLWRRGVVGVYLPSHRDGELDTAPLLARLWSKGHRVVAPVVSPRDARMAFYRYQPDTRLVLNRFGIAEPAPGSCFIHPLSLCVLLVPLVAFDARGSRLGMGGGFYDRFLGSIPATMRPRIVGLAHEIQRSNEPLPADEWDIGLNDVVTEAGWQRFTRQT